MKRRELFIHVGMHRTSTTSCQAVFHHLQSCGFSAGYFHYPLVLTNSTRSEYGHAALIDKKNSTIIKESVEQLLTELDGIKESRLPILLSAEDLWSVNPVEVRDLFKDFEIKIICFKREIIDWILSIWGLVTLEGDIFDPYEFIVGALEDIGQKRKQGTLSFYDQDGISSRWKDVFGISNFHEILYPVPIPHAAILDIVCNEVLPEWKQIKINLNPSLSLRSAVDRINSRRQRQLITNGIDEVRMKERIERIKFLIADIYFPTRKTIEYLKVT